MKILILGNERTDSVKKLKVAGEKKGHEVTVLSPEIFLCEVSEFEKGYDKLFRLAYTKYVRVYKSDFDAVINRVSGATAEIGGYITKQFQILGVFVTNPSESIKNCSDKFLSHQILSEAKLPNPKTILCPNVVDFQFIGKRLGLPFIAKKRKGSSQGKGVFKINDIDTANQFLGMVDEKLLLQEYIDTSENGQSSDIRAFVVGNDETGHEVVASYKRISNKGEWKANYSISKQGEKVELTDYEKEIAIKASEAMGTGINGVDIVRRNGNDSTIIECNSNPGLTGVTAITGVDVATKVIEFVEKATNNKSKTKKTSSKDQTLHHLRKPVSPPKEVDKEIEEKLGMLERMGRARHNYTTEERLQGFLAHHRKGMTEHKKKHGNLNRYGLWDK